MSLKIPKLTNTELEALYEKIRPLVRGKDGNAYPIERVDLRKVSFTWDPKLLKEPITALHSLGEFRCLHTYGYYGLFKPSIDEVLSQIPANLVDAATYFEIVKQPGNQADLGEEQEALNAGFHVSTVRVYSKPK